MTTSTLAIETNAPAAPAQQALSVWRGLPLIVALALILYKAIAGLLPDELSFDPLSFGMNAALGLLLVLWLRQRGFHWGSLGLAPSRPWSTLLWGCLWGITASVPSLLAVAFPGSLTATVHAQSWQGMSMANLFYLVFFRIPVGTALFEEAVFRGVMFSSWEPRLGARRAALASSAVFGLWHIVPMFDLFKGSQLLGTPLLLAGAVIAGVLVTFVGGLVFCWVRCRTGSIYGAAVAHWLIDALATVAPFVVTH